MHILYCCHADNYHIEKWIHSLQSCGVKVSVLTLRPHPKPFFDQISATPLWDKISYLDFIALAPKIRDTFKELKPDLIFCSFASTYGLAGYLSGLSPLVIQTWSRDIGVSNSVTFREKLYSNYISRNVCEKSNGVTTDGPHFLDLIRKNWNIPVQKSHSTWWGVDQNFWINNSLNKRDAKKKLGLDPDKALIFFPRGLFWYYRPNEILETIELLKRRNNKITICIAVIGQSITKSIKRKLQIVNQHDDVIVLYQKQNKFRFRDWFRASDFFVSVPLFDGISESVQEGIFSGSIPILNPISANLKFNEIGIESFNTLSEQPSSQDLYKTINRALDSSFESRNAFIQNNMELLKNEASDEKTSMKLISFFNRIISLDTQNL